MLSTHSDCACGELSLRKLATGIICILSTFTLATSELRAQGAASQVEQVSQASEEARIRVNGVRFEGNTLFTDQELLTRLGVTFGREFTFTELKKMATQVEEYYHEKGYRLARVIISQQDINQQGGVIEFTVLEGWLGDLSIIGNQRYSDARIRRSLSKLLVGEPFKMKEMERSLLYLNRTPGVEVSSTLKPGAEVGSTAVEIEVREERRVLPAITVNNHGSESTGELRIIPTVDLPNLTGRGDLLSAFVMFAPEESDLYFGQLSYSVPLFTMGTRFNSYISAGNYAVGGEFSSLEIEGDNFSWGLGLSHDIIFSGRTSLTFEGWFESASFEQTLLGFVTSEDDIRKLRFGATLDHRDSYGRTFLSLDVHKGLGENLGGMENESPLSSRSFARADNNFTKVTADLTRVQRLHPRILVIGRLQGQYAAEPVVASEQIAIGGANSVRGHPQSVFAGDDGFIANLEANYAILPDDYRYQFAVFADHGYINTKRPAITQSSSESISGAGFGVRASVFDRLDIRVDLGVPVGGKTEDSAYVYAQARFSF